MDSATAKYVRHTVHQEAPPPPIRTRYFYASATAIDDPLAPIPPPASSNAKSRLDPRPFSANDNDALENAWLGLRKRKREADKTSNNRRKQDIVPSSRDDTDKDNAKASGSRSKKRTSPASSDRTPYGPQSGERSELYSEGAATVDLTSLNTSAATEADITGMPFARAPSREASRSIQKEDHPVRPPIQTKDTYDWDDPSHLADAALYSQADDDNASSAIYEHPVAIPVGASRLHQVQMPSLDMMPIYWTPVNDFAQVIRGTWFYQDTMLPVEPNVAIMLEAGYTDLRCWTQTWKDELASAVEVGAEGEEKIVHMLWPETNRLVNVPEPRPRSKSTDGQGLLNIVTENLVEEEVDTPEQVRQKAVEAAMIIIDLAAGEGGADNKAAASADYNAEGKQRLYSSCGVIYANDREARLLKPSLMPSAYYGRRPLANYIRNGHKLGIPVVRGFDPSVWRQLHPTKSSAKAAPKLPTALQSGEHQVSDLVLVIHGIGQKLSKRMESFHFTHAINAFRRDINLEVANKEIRARFRDGMGGIMALPINWRHQLAFEEGGYRDGVDDPAVNEFTLNDITPHTLPSVRNIVSDVMLDIPYYMSHHQPKMIAAVLREANRVYQLWCRNNPGFAKRGRVHVIAHSLGSVMAIDILSNQPTRVPDHLSDPTSINLAVENLNHFLFNTSNLFLAGSPAGFFLLLKKSQLLPRLDDKLTGSLNDPLSNNISICGEQGQYGCIAVDNVYNIINPYDPVAYRMNAAVDSALSTSLRQAVIPSATPGWFGVGTKSNTLFGGLSTTRAARPIDSEATGRPGLQQLPSNVELETHNFTREEIAEKRMLRLNDNGQIDFFLRYGGGAFDIPYLTMLGAHSSYWLLRDFVRLIVTEVARPPGRDGTFLGLRAAKRKKNGS